MQGANWAWLAQLNISRLTSTNLHITHAHKTTHTNTHVCSHSMDSTQQSRCSLALSHTHPPALLQHYYPGEKTNRNQADPHSWVMCVNSPLFTIIYDVYVYTLLWHLENQTLYLLYNDDVHLAWQAEFIFSNRLCFGYTNGLLSL